VRQQFFRLPAPWLAVRANLILVEAQVPTAVILSQRAALHGNHYAGRCRICRVRPRFTLRLAFELPYPILVGADNRCVQHTKGGPGIGALYPTKWQVPAFRAQR
jgi:hypothetical protein